MRVRLGLKGVAVIALCALGACFDFDDAHDGCVDGGRCFDPLSPADAGSPDGSTGDDAGADGGALPDAGPVDAGPLDAGPPDAGPPDAGPPDAGEPGLCYPLVNAGGLSVCLENPAPFGEGLRGVWVSPQGTVWIVGRSGLVARRSGNRWIRLDVPLTGDSPSYASNFDWNGISGTSDSDVYVAGQSSGLIHFHDGGWSQVAIGQTSGDLTDVHCVQDAGCWAVQDTQTILTNSISGSWDRLSAFATVDAAATGVWVNPRGDAWVTAGDAVHEWNPDAGTWTEHFFGPLRTRNAVYGTSSSQVWVAGVSQLGVWRWNGTSAVLEDTPLTPTINDLHGVGEDLWAISPSEALHRPASTGAWSDGGALAPGLRSIFTTADAGTWIVGDDGLIFHGTDGGWSELSGGSRVPLRRVSSTDVNNAWAVGGSTVLRRTGTAWEPVTAPIGATWYGVHTFGPDDTWIVGSGGAIHHWTGASWTQHMAMTASTLFAIWGANPSDVWVVGDNGTILHWDGTNWSKGPTFPSRLENIHGTGPDNIWATGSNGMILRGPFWTQVAPPPGEEMTYFGGISVSPDEVWVTSNSAVHRLHRSDGWKLIATSNNLNGYSVLALSKDEVWATGGAGMIWKFDRASDTFIRHATGTRRDLLHLGATSGGGFFAVGDSGAVRHFRR